MHRMFLASIATLALFALSTNALATVPQLPPKASVKVQNKRILLGIKPQFVRGKAILLKSCHEQLRLLGKYLRKHKSQHIRIEAHSNSRGSSRFNKRKTQLQAKAIKKFLGAEGIDPNRVVATGYGESRPIASNRTRAGRLKNARIEFHIGAKKKKK